MSDFHTLFQDDDDVDAITVTLPNRAGDGVDEYEVYPPTAEQLMLFADGIGADDRAAGAILGLLEAIFDEADYAQIRARLAARRSDPARLRLADLMKIVEVVMEDRSDFPSQLPSGSPQSSGRTGPRSTGRVHSKASTRAGSVSAGS